jgi:DNA repair exonuclease SbcCD ATPase subunit
MSTDPFEHVCPVCGDWRSDAESDPEERARINAAFAGRKSGQLAEARDQLQEAVSEVERLRTALREMRQAYAAFCENDDLLPLARAFDKTRGLDYGPTSAR